MKLNLINWREDDPPPNPSGGDSEGNNKLPEDFIEYLKSKVIELNLDEDNLVEIVRSLRSPIIFTELTDLAREYLEKQTELTIVPVGSSSYATDAAYYLVGFNRLSDSRTPSLVEVSSSALIRFNKRHARTAAKSIDHDIMMETNDGRILMAVSSDEYQSTLSNGDLQADLNVSFSYGVLGNWISKGEERLYVDRSDLSVVEYHIAGSSLSPRTKFQPVQVSDAYHFQQNEEPSRINQDIRLISNIAISMITIGISMIIIGYSYNYVPAFLLSFAILSTVVLQIYRTASIFHSKDSISVVE